MILRRRPPWTRGMRQTTFNSPGPMTNSDGPKRRKPKLPSMSECNESLTFRQARKPRPTRTRQGDIDAGTKRDQNGLLWMSRSRGTAISCRLLQGCKVEHSRRHLLGFAALALGSGVVEALATPFWKWTSVPLLEAALTARSDDKSPVTFVDVAKEAGLTAPNIWGGVKSKKYLVEVKGSGLAFFDFDNDGWLDIYLTNGVRLGETYTPQNAPTSHLFKNNRDGTFTDVTAHSGLGRTGWGTGVCVGDYDNDGWDDLFCTYWGQNLLFHNNGDGSFTDVTAKAGLREERLRWGSGCTWLDYDRDGFLDLFVSNYVELDINRVPNPGETGYCQWKSVPVACGPQGLPGGKNILYHNNGEGTFTEVSAKAGVLKPGVRPSLSAVSYDFD